MRLENSFVVDAPLEDAWRLLNDVPAVLPCMPGAELLEIDGDDAWKAALAVKLGPIALRFLADITRDRSDAAERHVVLTIAARETKGRGSARATIDSNASETGTGTRVDIVTELTLQGVVAQHGRGIVADVAARLTEQFAGCVAEKLAGPNIVGDRASPNVPPRPIGGFRLLLAAIGRALMRRR